MNPSQKKGKMRKMRQTHLFPKFRASRSMTKTHRRSRAYHLADLQRIAKEVADDKKVLERAEDFRRRYGTLSERDFVETFTI